MNAVDTNVLVRLIIQDDESQVAAANAFISDGVWASTLALAETVWVLRTVYRTRPAGIGQAVEMLLNNRYLSIQDADAVAAALNLFRSKPALGFTDCLMLELARKAGHLPMGTFDGGLARIDGAQKL